MTESAGETKAIVVEQVFAHSPAKLWRALTRAELIDEWLMKTTGFVARVGCRFTFRAQPMGDWNGIVECEVLEVIPEERLRYSWRGGSVSVAARYALDSVVTWTLEATEAGTRVRMVHDGFRPENELGRQAMSGGWPRIVERLGAVAGALA